MSIAVFPPLLFRAAPKLDFHSDFVDNFDRLVSDLDSEVEEVNLRTF